MRPLLAGAAVTAGLLLPVGPAAATPAPVSGAPCQVLVDAGTKVVVAGGPVVLADDDPAGNPVRGTLTCTIRWASADDGSATSEPAYGVVALPPTVLDMEPVTYAAHVCSRVDVDGGPSYYWDSITLSWSTAEGRCANFRYSPCDSVTDPDCGGLGPILYTILPAAIDHRICPVLKEAFPPEGDVWVGDVFVWDCPPYVWES